MKSLWVLNCWLTKEGIRSRHCELWEIKMGFLIFDECFSGENNVMRVACELKQQM